MSQWPVGPCWLFSPHNIEILFLKNVNRTEGWLWVISSLILEGVIICAWLYRFMIFALVFACIDITACILIVQKYYSFLIGQVVEKDGVTDAQSTLATTAWWELKIWGIESVSVASFVVWVLTTIVWCHPISWSYMCKHCSLKGTNIHNNKIQTTITMKYCKTSRIIQTSLTRCYS